MCCCGVCGESGPSSLHFAGTSVRDWWIWGSIYMAMKTLLLFPYSSTTQESLRKSDRSIAHTVACSDISVATPLAPSLACFWRTTLL